MPTPPPKGPARPSSAPSSSTTKTASKPKKKPETQSEQIDAVLAGDMTWAEAMGLTRTEAYGIAFAAHRLFEHGQVARAKKMLEGLIVANPKDAYFPTLLGAIYGREGKEDQALKLYDDAVRLDPQNLTARVNRADLLLRRGILDKALQDLVAATKLDPKGATPLGKRAFALARATSASLHALLKKKKR
jgi:predicted Zn-dependent protease